MAFDGFESKAIRYPRAHRAGIVWGHWLREGCPKFYTVFRSPLAGLFGNGGSGDDGDYFMAYGTETENHIATLFDRTVRGTEKEPGLAVGVQGLLFWFYWRLHARGEPLLVFPAGWQRTGQEPLETPEPIFKVSDYCERFKLPRDKFWNRLNLGLRAVESSMIDRTALDLRPPNHTNDRMAANY